jgi:hypothetical protein
MLRMALALAVVSAGVRVEAAPSKPEAGKRVKKPAKASKRGGARRDKSSRKKAFSRSIEAKRLYDGLPPGFSWPPTRPMEEAGRACEAKLDAMGVKWQHAAKLGRIANPITITDRMLGGIKYTNMFGDKASNTMECQLGVALATIGPELHGLGVREVKYGSIYDLSYIRTLRGGRTLSRHAIAVAMDIGSFVDETGRDVKVVTSYKDGDNLLLALEELFIASSDFHNVITPKNDPVSHYNHFHVEAVVDFRAPSRTTLSMR